MSTNTHRWRFFRAGGFDQPSTDQASDYGNLDQLDQKLWAALACPVKGLEFDERTLALIDTDSDGRVRAPEIIAAGKWCATHIRDLGSLKNGTDSVPLSGIRTDDESGAAVAASAKRILVETGKADASAITLMDVDAMSKAFAETRLNGDGIVPADSADDETLAAAITDAITAMGAVTDRSGKDGIDQAKVDAFFEQAAAFVAWADQPAADEAILPLGDDTAGACAAWRAVKVKVDDYFARCKLAAYDDRALAAVNRGESEYAGLAASDLSLGLAEVAELPLAPVDPAGTLSLTGAVNPAWTGAVAALKATAVDPLLGGQDTLTEADWTALGAKFAAYEAWQAAKPETGAEALGVDRLRELLAGDAKDAMTALIAEDAALAPEFEQIVEVERLVRYHRDFHLLLRNFVNLGDFYDREKLATFQAGTLYMDSRKCVLCVRVADAGKHAKMAALAKAYLAYLTCTRPSGEKMDIVAAFTDGDSDYMMVGRNGIFYDRKGRDWDATVTKVVANPISIREAFWSPYKKLVRAIEDMVAKRAAAAEKASDKKMSGAATTVANVDKAQPPAAAPKVDVGAVAAMGVAAGMIGIFVTTLIGYITGLFEQPFWIVCVVLAAILLVISGPSMLIAWLKLRQRNLGPILDANGWAVNARAKMTVKFGKSLTEVATLPEGATIVGGDDPDADKPSSLPGLVKFVVVVCFLFSLLNYFGLIYTGLVDGAGLNPSDIPAVITEAR